MKDIEQAIADTLKKQNKSPADIVSLNLDSKCKSTHVKGLNAFTNLKSLSLSSLGLTSLEGFPSLPKLTTLVLAENRISGGLTHLVSAGLTSLESLDLAGNRIASLEELEPLKQLKQLRSLDLLACPVCTKVPDLPAKLFAMLDELKYLNGADKEGLERDGDEGEEDAEEDDAGEEEFEDGGGEGEEEFEDEEGGEFEEADKEYAVLVGDAQVGEDEEGDYVDEGEGEEDDDDEEAGEGEDEAGQQGTKRKREEGEEEAQ